MLYFIFACLYRIEYVQLFEICQLFDKFFRYLFLPPGLTFFFFGDYVLLRFCGVDVPLGFGKRQRRGGERR